MASSTLQHPPSTLNKATLSTAEGTGVAVRQITSADDGKHHVGIEHKSTAASSKQSSISTLAPPSASHLAPAKPCLAAGPKMETHANLAISISTTLSPSCSGPSAASYSVPPRPKPGRKPAVDKPSEKRKAQNREAQRAFRERKVAHTEELRNELDQLKQIYDNVVLENGSLKRKLHEMQEAQSLVEQQSQQRELLVSQLQEQVRKYHQQEERWARVERMHTDAHQRLKQYEASSKRKDNPRRPSRPTSRELLDEIVLTTVQHHNPLTPPQHSPVQEGASCGDCAQTGYCKCVEDFTVDFPTVAPVPATLNISTVADPSYEELEMDFTSNAVPRSPTTAALHEAHHKPGCGFCEDPTDCPCQIDSTNTTSTIPTLQRADPMQISSIVEPGTCLKCQEDPDQRRFCIEVSKSRPIAQDLPDRTSNKRPRLDDGRPRTLTCNELYQASKHVVAESKRTGRSKPAEMESMFNSYAKKEIGNGSTGEARPGMRYRKYSTLEIDGIETLAALSRTGTK